MISGSWLIRGTKTFHLAFPRTGGFSAGGGGLWLGAPCNSALPKMAEPVKLGHCTPFSHARSCLGDPRLPDPGGVSLSASRSHICVGPRCQQWWEMLLRTPGRLRREHGVFRPWSGTLSLCRRSVGVGSHGLKRLDRHVAPLQHLVPDLATGLFPPL